jgi:hypothetical protein
LSHAFKHVFLSNRVTRNAHKIVDLVVNSIDTAPILIATINHGFSWLIVCFGDCLWLFIVQIISDYWSWLTLVNPRRNKEKKTRPVWLLP